MCAGTTRMNRAGTDQGSLAGNGTSCVQQLLNEEETHASCWRVTALAIGATCKLAQNAGIAPGTP
jgi:hypothetical protein